VVDNTPKVINPIVKTIQPVTKPPKIVGKKKGKKLFGKHKVA